MEIRAARRSERDEVLDLLASWYNDRNFFARYNQHDPGCRDELCLVAHYGARIVATAQIFDRLVNFADQAVPLGGIGSVYTHENARKRGLASELMRLAIATMEREGFEVSLLFTERTGFYVKFGWRAVNRTFTAIAGAENLAALVSVADRDDPAGALVDGFDAERDLAPVAAIHRAYSGPLNGTVVRDDRNWHANLVYAGNPREHFVVARGPDGRVIAYARAILMEGYPVVMEYGYERDAVRAMLALFAHLGAIVAGGEPENSLARDGREILKPADAQAAPILATHSIHDPALEEILTSLGCFLMHHEESFYMWRMVAPEKFARHFAIPPAAAEAKLFEIVEDKRSLFWTADRF